MLRRAVMNTAARAKAGQALGRANTRSFGSHGAPKYKTMFGEKVSSRRVWRFGKMATKRVFFLCCSHWDLVRNGREKAGN
mmetsp:Transcript_9673/g.21031  ORF Transcript_9673/g.21031 Transcript_9673/m.21031 type:complete len:80 (+) Transcript_9673:191-430(+)